MEGRKAKPWRRGWVYTRPSHTASTHHLYPRGDSPYELVLHCERIQQAQLTGSLYIKSSRASAWDRIPFVGIGTNAEADEVTLVTIRNHDFSGRYKLLFAFGQVSVVFINDHLKYELALKQTKTYALPPPSKTNNVSALDANTACVTCSHGCGSHGCGSHNCGEKADPTLANESVAPPS